MHRLRPRAALLLPALLGPLLGPFSAAQEEGGDGFTQEELEELTEDIKQDVEELRGLDFERPVAVSVTDREGFLAYAQERLEETSSPEELRAQEEIGKLLGLLPADYDLLAETLAVLEEQVGGFYDPSADAFYLMESFGGGLARIILAHELTHALDDQHFGIDERIAELRGNSDALFAYHAVVEGSGTAVMNRWTIDHLAELDAAALADGGGLSMEAVAKAPAFVWRPLIATYLAGAAFLVKSENLMKGQTQAAAPRDIDRAFREPPRSSEQVLHPEKYWDPERRDDPRALAFDTTGLSEGWEVLHQDTLGELGLALLTEPLEERGGLDPTKILFLRFTDDAASGWDGDRALLLGSGARRALLVASVWDEPAAVESSEVAPSDASPSGVEALEFAERVRELHDHLRDAAGAYAAAFGLEGAVVETRHAPGSSTVLLAVGAGLGEGELAALVDALPFEVLPEDAPPAGER